MSVYVGIGSNPLWMMGPAFIGMQDPEPAPQPRRAAWARDIAQQRMRQQFESANSSWETIPPPTRRGLGPKTTVFARRPAPQPPVYAQPPQPPGGGILAALLRWLQG